MKKILLLTLVTVLTTLGVQASGTDTVTIGVTKSGDNTAKVVTWPGDKNPTMVPITFADGTSWSDVKDSYEVSQDTVTGLDSKKMAIYVNSDSGLSFRTIKPMSKTDSKKTK